MLHCKRGEIKYVSFGVCLYVGRGGVWGQVKCFTIIPSNGYPVTTNITIEVWC